MRFRRKRADCLLKSRNGQRRFTRERPSPGIRAASQKRKEKRLDFPLQRCLGSALREVSRRYEKDTHWSSGLLECVRSVWLACLLRQRSGGTLRHIRYGTESRSRGKAASVDP